MRRRLTLLAAALLTGCLSGGEPPEGLFPAPAGTGPQVVWDLDHRPLPDIPFPNDVATRIDPTSPTGRRVNISLQAPTDFEADLRKRAERLTGFGIFQPVTVGFDAPIDLCEVARRHHRSDGHQDDAVYLVNVTDGEHFGELVDLDMGRGFFPNVTDRGGYFENDPGTGSNLMLADHPFPPASCADLFEYDRNTFYEHETNTLIFQPMNAMRERATYAVVLTRRLVGEDGEPVRSPFEWVSHARQVPSLRRLGEALPQGTTLEDVAFVWTFTTQDASSELLDIRRGLYGHGPFASLAEDFPPGPESVRILDVFDDEPAIPDNPYIVPFRVVVDTIEPYLEVLLEGVAEVGPVLETFDHLDYLVVGRFTSPNFIVDRDGIEKPDEGCDPERRGDPDWDCRLGMKADDDESFELDPRTGEMVVGEAEVPFWCVVPKKDRKQAPGPFPVIIYHHGYSSARLEMIAFAGSIARWGIATCVAEAVAHGIVIGPDLIPQDILRGVFEGGGIGKLFDDVSPGRARDLNNDGIADVGGDFYSANAFHTRDVIRQTIVDNLTMVRMLRTFDGRPGHDFDGDGRPELFGDFDADGEIDLGGPDATYYAWGTSMGGIHSAIVAAIEPAITAAAPNAGAAGLFDVAVRSSLGAVVRAVWLPLMGPIIYGQPAGERGTAIYMQIPDVADDVKILLGYRWGLQPGDEVIVENLDNGELGRGSVDPSGRFRVSVAADAMNATEKRARMGFDVLHPEHPDWGQVPVPVVPDTTKYGDRLVLRGCKGPCGTTQNRFLLDTFEEGTDTGEGGVEGVYYQGTIYPKGAPLIALAEGFGNRRQTPEIRRLRGIAGFMQEPGDPAVYTRYYWRDRDELEAYWEGAEPDLEFGTRVMAVVTLGDTTVPTSAGVMLAWTAGFFDGDYGKLRWLRDNYVLEAVEELRTDVWGGPVLFDPDNLSDGTDGFEVDGVPAPRPPPGQELRLTHEAPDGYGTYGMRIPAVEPRGAHVFLVPDPTLPFDVNTYMVTQIGAYFAENGMRIRDEPCMADLTCDWIPYRRTP